MRGRGAERRGLEEDEVNEVEGGKVVVKVQESVVVPSESDKSKLTFS